MSNPDDAHNAEPAYIPLHVIAEKLIPSMNQEDILAFSLTNKALQLAITPAIHSYSELRCKIGRCLENMIDFMEEAGRHKVLWKFSYRWIKPISENSLCLVLFKKGAIERKYQINGESISSQTMRKQDVMTWFRQHMMRVCPDISFYGQCSPLMSDQDRKEFILLTHNMLHLLQMAKVIVRKAPPPI